MHIAKTKFLIFVHIDYGHALFCSLFSVEYLLTLLLLGNEKNIDMEVLIDEFVLFYFAGARGIPHILCMYNLYCHSEYIPLSGILVCFALGQETTSTLLSFTTGLLIQHPDILRRLI